MIPELVVTLEALLKIEFSEGTNMYPDVADRGNQSIQEYIQRTSVMGVSRGSHDSQGKWGH